MAVDCDHCTANATQLAAEIHVNKSTVSRTLASFDLAEELQADIDKGKISIKDAIAKQKAETKPTAAKPKKTKKKRTKEERSVTSGFR